MGAIDGTDDIKQATRVLQLCYPKIIVAHEVQEAVDGSSIVQVIKNGKRIVGVMIAERDMHEIYIRRIAVLDEYRLKGYARGMINNLLRQDHVKLLTLSVPGWEPTSVAFAHRCGFHVFGIDADNEGFQVWRLSSRANASSRNRIEQYFSKRLSRKGDFGRRY